MKYFVTPVSSSDEFNVAGACWFVLPLTPDFFKWLEVKRKSVENLMEDKDFISVNFDCAFGSFLSDRDCDDEDAERLEEFENFLTVRCGDGYLVNNGDENDPIQQFISDFEMRTDVFKLQIHDNITFMAVPEYCDMYVSSEEISFKELTDASI